MEHAWAIFILLLEGLGIVAALTAVGMVVLHRINAALKLKAINDEYNQKQLQVARHNKHQLFIADQDAKFETQKRLLLEAQNPPKRRSRKKADDGLVIDGIPA
jgi:hypothetical protein